MLYGYLFQIEAEIIIVWMDPLASLPFDKITGQLFCSIPVQYALSLVLLSYELFGKLTLHDEVESAGVPGGTLLPQLVDRIQMDWFVSMIDYLCLVHCVSIDNLSTPTHNKQKKISKPPIPLKLSNKIHPSLSKVMVLYVKII